MNVDKGVSLSLIPTKLYIRYALIRVYDDLEWCTAKFNLSININGLSIVNMRKYFFELFQKFNGKG